MKNKLSYLADETPTRRKLTFALGASALLLLAAQASAADLSISSVINGRTATLTASDNYGGAIRSFVYGGFEYVDDLDLGRDIQSAVAFDGYGECYNPNEAGNNRDTPSQLLAWSAAGGVLATSTNMAFWLAPGESGVCFNGATHALNTTVHSGLILEKSVRFGSDGVPNVLDYRVKYNVNENRGYAVFEALTGYLKYNFIEWFTFDPQTSTLARLDLPVECYTNTYCTYQNLPIIASLIAGTHSMGIYAPTPPNGGYGAHRNSNAVDGFGKWNAVYVESPVTAGVPFERRFKVPFGTVEEVTTAMRSITGVSLPLIPVFRFFANNDHFLTLSYSEAASTAVNHQPYRFEKTAFRVYAAPQDGGMVPLYRCYSAAAADHFVSAASNCEGQQFEGAYGYVSSYPRDGYEPIYRFYRNNISDHLTTTDYSEGVNGGYVFEGTLGYAPTRNY